MTKSEIKLKLSQIEERLYSRVEGPDLRAVVILQRELEFLVDQIKRLMEESKCRRKSTN